MNANEIMAREHKGDSAPRPPTKTSLGKHGGNRGGDQTRAAEQPKKSSQAAGKDPSRSKRQK
ncbi:hypothetical protein KXR53_24785 [Inquilinus limosus]|uniref:hypothetical protein n=1 Tax=Inquilinus limosus TaxID=171674 RepID=UPI003F17D861